MLASSVGIYLMLAAVAAVLINDTGGLTSAFVAFWVVISVFASVFGLWGLLPLFFVILGVMLLALFKQSNQFPIETIITLFIGGIAPLIASYIIFHTKKAKGDKEDLMYSQLTTELTQETNKSSTVIRAISEGVIAVNPKGIIELINPAAEHIIGWGGADAVGLDYKSVLKLTNSADQSLDEATDPVVNVLSTNNEVHRKDLYTTTNGGKRLILSLVVSPIGQLGEGALIVFRDITKEQAEEREMAEFISTASHEMRTPVASIEGYLGLALNPNTATVDQKARDFIEKAHASAQHLGRLFQDLLDVSKAEDGRLSNHPGIVDIVSFVGQVTEGLQPKATEKGLRLFYRPDPNNDNDQKNLSPVFYANVDNDHLREVVQNLIENAVKYTPQGDVVVDVTGDEEHVKISIQDSGIGIPKEDIPHLFQKFYRVDNTATREIGGTGLGLYLCRRLAEVMGGRIWVNSEFQKGSTFYLEIPRTSREEATQLIEAAAADIKATQTNIEPAEISTPIYTTSTEPQPVPAQEATLTAIQFNPQPTSISLAPPVEAQPQAFQPTATATPQPQTVPAPQTPSPTLASIEQNPGLYTQQRPSASISIPVRDSTQQNQP